MVLTKNELIESLQHEVRVLLHLASKIDRSMLDYRPTPKQRSTLELLKYLSLMGPGLVEAAKSGDRATTANVTTRCAITQAVNCRRSQGTSARTTNASGDSHRCSGLPAP